MKKYTIFFLPGNKRIEINEGATLLEAVQKSGAHINNVCGGVGSCGKCKVIVKKGRAQTRPSPLLTNDEIKKGYVLACQARIVEDLFIEIPEESRITQAQIVMGETKPKDIFQYGEIGERQSSVARQPVSVTRLVKKIYVELSRPTLHDNLSDLERLLRELKPKLDDSKIQVSLPITRMLTQAVRKQDWKVTVTLAKRGYSHDIIQVEPGDSRYSNYAIALDVGTTTVVVQLIDIASGKVIDTRGNYNKQVVFGEDVISRIIHACEQNGLDDLHNVVVENVNELVKELAEVNGIKLLDINAILCSGNTTMAHLLLKLEPCYIRRDPYIPTATFYPDIKAKNIGIGIHSEAPVYCIPGVSSYVGGDITAGVLACGMSEQEEISLLIDIGTNGEIALGNKDWLVCCSASAGPAFEGSGIKYGMRATNGAMQRVKVTPEYTVEYSTIGDLKPKGICGSGLIDCLAEMLKTGVINRSGKLQENIKTPRLKKTEEGLEFVIAFKEETDIDSDIIINDNDAANLIRSKAAVYAGASILMAHMGLTFKDINKIYVAGGFGNYLDIKKAIFIGLLPDISIEKFEFIGNSSLSGARIALLSDRAFNKARAIAEKMTYVELSIEPSFMDEYVSAMFLPHTHIELFSSVMETLDEKRSIKKEGV